LAESVGRYTRSASGGKRRLWFDIPDDAVPASLREDDRVIIRQHPHGHALRIDFGRYKEADRSKTRIRYTTETDPGSSGAPCFNQKFELIGMHNADYRPDGGVSVLNQAIRFDHIAKKIRASLTGFNTPPPARLWNASMSVESPAAIFGRATFLDWIGRASAALPENRADRQFAAIATRKGSGRTFSVDILRAARRSLLDRILILGTDTEAVPASVPDFLAAIADQLRIPLTELAGLPPRPSAELPATSADGDKLYKWASEDVPRWFSNVLRQQREHRVDRVEEAKKVVKALEDIGRTPSNEDLALAARPDKLIETRYRWERIWIVIDRLSEEQQSDQVRLSEEVRNLIAGLTGGRLDEAAVPEELRRLRWIFLGQKPDLLLASQICSEQLDPDAIGLEDLIDCIAALADTFNKPLVEEAIKPLRASLKLWMRDSAVRSKLEETSERLETLQRHIAQLAPMLAEEYRGDHGPG
jgi:signal transduction histidine kinase